MRKLLTVLALFSILLSCNNRNNQEIDLLKKENELLKREMELEKREKQIVEESSENKPIKQEKKLTKEDILNSDIKKLTDLVSGGLTLLQMDAYGKIKYDSGTGSNGRFSGNLNNVNIDIEYKKQNPLYEGLGNPSEGIIAVINFKCKHEMLCLTNLGFDSDSGIMTFYSRETADKVYNLLKRIQKNL